MDIYPQQKYWMTVTHEYVSPYDGGLCVRCGRTDNHSLHQVHDIESDSYYPDLLDELAELRKSEQQ